MSKHKAFVNGDIEEKVILLSELHKEYDSTFSNISFAELSGKRWNYKGVIGNIGHRNYFQQVIETKLPAISDILISNTTGNLSMVIATPVLNKNNDIVGVIYATWELTDLMLELSDFTFENTGYSFIFTEYASVLSHSNDISSIGTRFIEKVLNDEIEIFKTNDEILNLWNSRDDFNFTNNKNIVIYNSYNNRINFVTSLDTRNVNSIYFGLSIDKNEFNSTFYTLLKIFLSIAIFFIIIIFIFAIYTKNANKKYEQIENQLSHINLLSEQVQLISGVAHEINTPLGVSVLMGTYIDKKMDQLKETGNIKYFNEIKNANSKLNENLDRTVKLVNSFKEIGKNSYVEEQNTINIKSFLEQIILEYHLRLEKQNIKVNINCKENIEVNLYSNSLKQIIRILITNTLNHAFPKNNFSNHQYLNINISHKINFTKSILLIDFSDNGIGIPDTFNKKVFQPFFTITNNQNNSGLGLFIANNIVENKLFGEIYSVKEDTGTRIHIKLDISN